MAKQKSKKKAQIQHKQKVEKRRKIMADQKEDVVGNNGEPRAPEVNGDAQKDAEMESQASIGVAPGDHEAYKANKEIIEAEILDEHAEKPFDPKSLIANILKKHGA